MYSLPLGALFDDRAIPCNPSVDRDHGSGDITSTRRGEKHDSIGNFLVVTHAPAGVVAHVFLPARLIAKVVTGAPLHDADHAIGCDRAGIDANDPYSIVEADATDCFSERH